MDTTATRNAVNMTFTYFIAIPFIWVILLSVIKIGRDGSLVHLYFLSYVINLIVEGRVITNQYGNLCYSLKNI